MRDTNLHFTYLLTYSLVYLFVRSIDVKNVPGKIRNVKKRKKRGKNKKMF